MTAAPHGAVTWKDQLLDGIIEPATARRTGELLADLMRAPASDQFRDQTVFQQLRIDPYYRATAARHPDLAPHFEKLIADSQARRVGLVHGDWSPKNLLVWPGGLMAIDFEVVHYGDPAFDVAFLMNHLLLKSFYRPNDRGRYAAAATAFLEPVAEWESPALQHLGPLLLARIDGKSPAEYLREADLRDRVRQFARKLILAPPAQIAEVFEL